MALWCGQELCNFGTPSLSTISSETPCNHLMRQRTHTTQYSVRLYADDEPRQSHLSLPFIISLPAFLCVSASFSLPPSLFLPAPDSLVATYIRLAHTL